MIVSQYNFVLSAAFTCGIAVSALVQFFLVAYPGYTVDWWGNVVVGSGCDDGFSCPLKTLAEGEYFGPDPGNYNV